jgi:hypothetical protein
MLVGLLAACGQAPVEGDVEGVEGGLPAHRPASLPGAGRVEAHDRHVDALERGVWVPETSHTSRDLLVLVEQSTEPVPPSDGVRIARRPLGEWS